MRTHTCGDLNLHCVGKNVALCGWMHVRRDHGGKIFIDLRDRYGITQVVFDPSVSKKAHEQAEKIGREFVLRITGKVRVRPEGMKNSELSTGEIEVVAESVSVLAASDTPRLDVDDRLVAGEDLRLKYRYLDLRRPAMQKNLIARHKAAMAVREYLSKNNFVEVETPLFVKHTPGGARVFKVASRTHPGKFYSLPESPQLYKQLLMVAGLDRYFQLAKCCRDEDLRADRQVEFTQIDIEASFISQDELLTLLEGLVAFVFYKVKGLKIALPLPRLTFYEAMSRFGSDKPDLRFGMELKEVTDVVKSCSFSIFRTAVENKGVVFALKIDKGARYTRGDIEELTKVAVDAGLPGLGWVKVGKTFEGSIAKYLDLHVQEDIKRITQSSEGDLICFSAGEFELACSALGSVRLFVAKKEHLIPEGYAFCWVVDFPLFEWNKDEQKWQARHHIFSHPREEDLDLLEKDPSKVRGLLHDCVLNGVEIGGGSIRINTRELQARVLKVTGMSLEDVEKTFDFLLEAFRYGAPPHGGIAFGFDRMCALLQGTDDIREVIAFPRTKAAENPLDGSPQEWTEQWLKELHLKLR
ncbi:aspartate--tRNA ligase [Candidatus Woesearchaeota archaeon]|nr:aspartate--tRNA ligase [Candidatus Woesearchaeota archaeon]